MIFQNIELKENKDKKLSFIEKTVLIAGISLGRSMLTKVRKAKTYGDIMKVWNLIDLTVDKLEAKYSGIVPDDKCLKEINDIEDIIKEL